MLKLKMLIRLKCRKLWSNYVIIKIRKCIIMVWGCLKKLRKVDWSHINEEIYIFKEKLLQITLKRSQE